MNNADLLLLNPKDYRLRDVTCGSLDDYYKNLDCRCFDITTRKIGDKFFDIFCDDEGLFKEGNPVSAVDKEFRPALVGNLIFANHDTEGNTTSLTDDDKRIIKDNIIGIYDYDTEEFAIAVILNQ